MVESALRHDVLFYGTGHEAWDGGGGWAARGVGGGLAWAVAWQEGDVRAEPAWLCSRRWFVHAARCVGGPTSQGFWLIGCFITEQRRDATGAGPDT